jgi:hypothetical protein
MSDGFHGNLERPIVALKRGNGPSRTPWSEGNAALWTRRRNHAEGTVPYQRVTASRWTVRGTAPQRDETGAFNVHARLSGGPGWVTTQVYPARPRARKWRIFTALSPALSFTAISANESWSSYRSMRTCQSVSSRLASARRMRAFSSARITASLGLMSDPARRSITGSGDPSIDEQIGAPSRATLRLCDSRWKRRQAPSR